MFPKIRDVMTKNVITVDVDYTVKLTAKIMSRYGIGCALVQENKKVVGIVTETDLLKKVIAVGIDPEKTFVREIMSKPLIVVEADAALEDAIKLMFQHKIKKLPVVEGPQEGAKLVGLVTLTDIARLQPHLIEKLKELFTQSGETAPRNIEKVINFYIV